MVSSISGTQISPMFATRAAGIAQADSNGGMQGTDRDCPPPVPPGGGFGNAIMQALSGIGIDVGTGSDTDLGAAGDSSAASDNGTGQAVSDALGSFMQALMETLHAQGASADASNQSGSESGDTAAAVRGHGGHHHGGPGNMQADLQSLIQKQGSSESDSTESTSDSSSTELEQRFRNLLSALGAADSSSAGDSSSTLGKFLQALQGNMQLLPSSGNMVNTTA